MQIDHQLNQSLQEKAHTSVPLIDRQHLRLNLYKRLHQVVAFECPDAVWLFDVQLQGEIFLIEVLLPLKVTQD